MTKQTLAYCVALLLSVAGFQEACSNTNVTGKDCRISCEDADNVCVQKCNDDQCRTTCKTDLDNCSASCGSVATGSSNPDAGGGGGY